ncbi:MAG: hypothetical protein VX663_00805 [Pseudomonadota bacterium]|nr:hypothetical protein [Pseudomonadota bacterium]
MHAQDFGSLDVPSLTFFGRHLLAIAIAVVVAVVVYQAPAYSFPSVSFTVEGNAPY